jgi:predicted transcriptional regulator
MPPTITSKSIKELEAILSQLSLTERAAFVEKAKEAVKRYLSSKELFVEKVGYSFQTFVTTMQKYMMEDRKLKNSQQKLHNAKPSNTEYGVVEEYDF